MRVTVIGCGNAFSKKSYNQSFLVEENNRKLLIDCGSQTPGALANAGIALNTIDDIYVSHAHADHCGGLEEFAFIRYDWAKRPRHYKDGKYAPRLICDEQLMKDLWDKTLRGGLESMEGFVSKLDTFFEPFPIEANVSFNWEGWTVNLIQQVHIMSGSRIMPSFGIMFKKEEHKTVYFVTDSQHCSPRQMEEFYTQSDLIFQDCECTGVNFQFQEGTKTYKDKDGNFKEWPEDAMATIDLMATNNQMEPWKVFKFGSGVHANYAQLAGYESANSIKLSSTIKSKMYLSHYQDFVLYGKDMYGNLIDWNKQAEKDGFAGFVKVGMEFEV